LLLLPLTAVGQSLITVRLIGCRSNRYTELQQASSYSAKLLNEQTIEFAEENFVPGTQFLRC
jgi:hypothetical protein